MYSCIFIPVIILEISQRFLGVIEMIMGNSLFWEFNVKLAPLKPGKKISQIPGKK